MEFARGLSARAVEEGWSGTAMAWRVGEGDVLYIVAGAREKNEWSLREA